MASILLIEARPAPEIRSALALAGHDLMTGDALGTTQNRRFDLALIDVAESVAISGTLPGVIENARRYSTRVVLVIETHEIELARLARPSGAHGYINKLGVQHLLDRVQYYLPR